MNFALTFLEGVCSFLSPCVLPLVPVYAVYFASGDADRAKAFSRSLAFVVGFTAVFTALGLGAGAIGGFLRAYAFQVRLATGLVTVLFGLSVLGLFHLPTLKVAPGMRLDGLLSAFAFGLVFPLMILPCAGPFLGAALMHAGERGEAFEGAVLLAVYSFGLGVPLVVTALFLAQLKNALALLRRNLGVINRICGVLLVALGVATACGLSFTFRSGISEKQENKNMATVIVNSANFEAEVLKSQIPVIVDFSATWCGPCQMLGPVLEEIAQERAGTVKVCKIDVDEAPDLAAKFGVTSIPAVFLVKDGVTAAGTVGFMPKGDLVSALGL